MTISGGHAWGVATSSPGATVTPSWSATPAIGSLLLLEVTTSRTSAVTYFGLNGATTPTGWTQFGEATWPTQSTKSCAQFYRIADGTASDTPTVGGYSGSARTSGLLAGTTYVSMMELQGDTLIGGKVMGSWDLSNAAGLGGSAALAGNYWGVGTSQTLASGTSWTEPESEAALWCVIRSNTVSATVNGTGFDSGQPSWTISTYGSISGINHSVTPGTSYTFGASMSSTCVLSMSIYVIGFTPTTNPTKTVDAGARIQGTSSTTIAAGGQIAPNAIYGSTTLAAGARIQAAATATVPAGARIQAGRSTTLAAGGAVQGPWSPKILMGTGNVLAEALGSQYFVLSGDIDGGDASSALATSAAPFTYVIDGGQASD